MYVYMCVYVCVNVCVCPEDWEKMSVKCEGNYSMWKLYLKSYSIHIRFFMRLAMLIYSRYLKIQSYYNMKALSNYENYLISRYSYIMTYLACKLILKYTIIINNRQNRFKCDNDHNWQMILWTDFKSIFMLIFIFMVVFDILIEVLQSVE